MRVLVVEDSATLAAQLRAALTEANFAVDVAPDGEEALSRRFRPGGRLSRRYVGEAQRLNPGIIAVIGSEASDRKSAGSCPEFRKIADNPVD